ncbi:MAG: phosphate ABC transporter permease PstA [Solirubrobacteraceae bacterium]
MTSTAHSEQLPYDPTSPLTPSGNLRRRLVVSRIAHGMAVAAAFVAVAALAIVVFDVVKSGASALNVNFLIQDPPQFGGAGGGIRSAIVGTTIIVALAGVIAVPIGVLIAIYMTEFAGPRSRIAGTLRLGLDLLQGVPSIVIGIFILGLITQPLRKDTGFAGSIALAIIMLPLVARSTQEVLRLVPASLREASDALGVDRWRSILTVVLPTALGGIVTGSILAVARAAGETAPLLVNNSTYGPHVTANWFGPMPNIPVLILTASDSLNPSGFPRAWGAALVLLVLILIANVGARLLLARSRRKMIG